METDLKGEITEVRKSVAQCIKKTESLENEMKIMKIALEDLQKMVQSWGGITPSSGSSGASRHSSQDVSFWHSSMNYHGMNWD